jgi:uncharacterized caspase-like protein
MPPAWLQNPKEYKVQVFASSSPEEMSQDNAAIRQGYYTQAFLEGLRGAALSSDRKVLTALDLARYTAHRVPIRTELRQNPQLYVSNSEELHTPLFLTRSATGQVAGPAGFKR